MGEKEPLKDIIQPGDIFFLGHSGTDDILFGYGLAVQEGRNDALVGLLMVDRPHPVDPQWLKRVEEAFGEYKLVPMTEAGEKGILCRMQIEPDSTQYLRRFPFEKTYPLQEALEPLMDYLPKPTFRIGWNAEQQVWESQIQHPNELPEELKEVLKNRGHGCLAVEADIGVVHVCYAPDNDIGGFTDKPVINRWQLVKMPTAPLIRLELIILDQPKSPFRFESFLNVAEEDQEKILAQLANQDHLILAFYGDDLLYRYTKIVAHDVQQWQLIDELTEEASRYWESIPLKERDFDKAKAMFMEKH